MMEKRNKLKDFLFWTILVLLALVATRVAYVYLYPYKPAIIHGAILVSPAVVNSGDTIYYKVDYEKLMDVPCVVTKTIVNHRLFNFTPTAQHFPLGRRVFEKPMNLPHDSTGECRIYFVLDFTVSSYPERVVRITKWSEPFMVKRGLDD